MPNWTQPPEWRDRIVYVPLEELSACVAGGDLRVRCKQYGDHLDAYILPSLAGHISAGIRYGDEPGEYLSLFGDQENLIDLLVRHQPEGAMAMLSDMLAHGLQNPEERPGMRHFTATVAFVGDDALEYGREQYEVHASSKPAAVIEARRRAESSHYNDDRIPDRLFRVVALEELADDTPSPGV